MNPVLPSVIACPLLWAAFVLLVPHGLLVFALLVVAVALGAASSAVRVRSR